MSLIVDVLDALVAKAETALAEIKAEVGLQVEPRRIISPTPPVIDMYPGDPSKNTESSSFDDRGADVFTLRARVSTADQDAGQDLLLALMDEHDLDLAGALEADQKLDGLTSSVMVEGPFGHTIYQDVANDKPLLGMEWRLTFIRTPGIS